MLFFTCTLFKNLHLIQLKQNHKKRISKRSKVEQKRGICTATLQISPWQDINWQLSRPGPDHCIGSTAFFWPHLCKSHWVPVKVEKFLKSTISLNLLYSGGRKRITKSRLSHSRLCLDYLCPALVLLAKAQAIFPSHLLQHPGNITLRK